MDSHHFHPEKVAIPHGVEKGDHLTHVKQVHVRASGPEWQIINWPLIGSIQQAETGYGS